MTRKSNACLCELAETACHSFDVTASKLSATSFDVKDFDVTSTQACPPLRLTSKTNEEFSLKAVFREVVVSI